VLTNVYAENLGWLFEDLKRHFGRMEGVAVSDRPLPDAGAWVALRTREAGVSPDLGRTAVCLHDLFDEEGMYQPGGSRGGVHGAGALVLCHPEQRRILAASGVPLEGRPILERPLGALSAFRPRERPRQVPRSFTVGWVGRNHPRKRLPWFVEAVRDLGAPVRAVLLGEGLEEAAGALRAAGIACDHCSRETHPISEYPRVYQDLDCVVITGTTEAGPLPLFEALASGVPVVSTPVGWAPFFEGIGVRIAESPAGITAHLEELRPTREEMFARRLEIAAQVAPWTLEGWLADVLEVARQLGLRAA
jgi:glycosyltransferase involved in cell wall biosynthesis